MNHLRRWLCTVWIPANKRNLQNWKAFGEFKPSAKTGDTKARYTGICWHQCYRYSKINSLDTTSRLPWPTEQEFVNSGSSHMWIVNIGECDGTILYSLISKKRKLSITQRQMCWNGLSLIICLSKIKMTITVQIYVRLFLQYVDKASTNVNSLT